MKKGTRNGQQGVRKGVGALVLALAVFASGFWASAAVAQDPIATITGLLTTNAETILVTTEPDPEPEPVPDPDHVPPSAAPAAPSAPEPAKKPKRKKKKEKKDVAEEEPIPAPFWHEPRDPPVLVASAPPFTSGPASPAAAPAPLSSPTGTSVVRPFALLAVGLGALLLGLAAIPQWVVRPARASILLDHWRVQIAATGLSAIFTAFITFFLLSAGP